MKYFSKTLLELLFKHELSKTGACASCSAARFHGTKEYAKEAVSKHRTISKDIRRDLTELLQLLDNFDIQVEHEYQHVVKIQLDKDSLT